MGQNEIRGNFVPMMALKEMKESRKIFVPRLATDVTILTFNIVNFMELSKDASAANICNTLNKFEDALKSRISAYSSDFFRVRIRSNRTVVM